MSISYRFNVSVLANSAVVQSTNTVSDEQSLEIQPTLTASQVDKRYNASFVGSRVSAYILQFDQDVTVEVNSGSSPAATIVLKANVPEIYHTNMPSSKNLFTGITVTDLYLTNNTANSATGKVFVLYDPTP